MNHLQNKKVLTKLSILNKLWNNKYFLIALLIFILGFMVIFQPMILVLLLLFGIIVVAPYYLIKHLDKYK